MPAAKSDKRFVRAKAGFVIPGEKSSKPRPIKGGQVLSADDPAVKGRDHLFEVVEDYIERLAAPKALHINKSTAPSEAAPKDGA